MKVYLTALFLIGSAFSAISVSQSKIEIGKGSWICSAEGIRDIPTLARGLSESSARNKAIGKCTEVEGSSFHCRVKSCEQDRFESNIHVDIAFDVVLDKTAKRVSVNLSNGDAAFECSTRAFLNQYKAEAPTKLEAKVLTRKVCIDSGNHGMHCKRVSCHQRTDSEVAKRRKSKGVDISLPRVKIDL